MIEALASYNLPEYQVRLGDALSFFQEPIGILQMILEEIRILGQNLLLNNLLNRRQIELFLVRRSLTRTKSRGPFLEHSLSDVFFHALF